MNILGIETSAGEGSLAVQRDEQIFTARIATPQAQAQQLIPLIDGLLSQAGIALGQLDAIGFGRGPGSFIGVRLASCVAQGLAAAAGIGLAPVSSMAALARQLASPSDAEQHVLVCVDARMNEVYWAEFLCTPDQVVAIAPERLIAPADVPWPAGGGWIAAGSGFANYVELSAAAAGRGFTVESQARPAALDVLPLARAAVRDGGLVAAQLWQGRYLRDETAWKAKE